MKIKISFCSKDNQRKKESLTNLSLARILEFRKWGYEYKMPYLDSTRQFRPMRRFVAKQGLPLAKIVINALKGKHSENENIAKDIAMRYKQYIKSGGLPFRTLASIKRNGVSLVETAQYIDSVFVKIESQE